MMVLCDYIRQINNGRNVFMFTGTPITNTLNEIYTMMRFTMSEDMEAAKVKDWDSWFNTFADAESSVELSSGGTYETFERLSKFVNLPELRKMAGRFMDIVFADDMPEFKPRAQREGRDEEGRGRPYKQIENVTIQMMPLVKDYSEELKARYIRFRDSEKKEKRRIMLAGEPESPIIIEQEGVKLALDPRLVDRFSPVANPANKGLIDPKDPGLKINQMIMNAIPLYHEHPKSVQMIFMEVGHGRKVTRQQTTGMGADRSTTRYTVDVFCLADEIERRLIEEGVPKEQIAKFSDLSKEQRKEAADKAQLGEIRFIIGSTSTAGTGINAQHEMIAMHHLDGPWTPGEHEQRNGRGHRQGNRWNTVKEFRYLTEGPQDGRRWQVLLNKARFITSFMRFKGGDERTIEMDDIDLSDSGSSDTGELADMQGTLSSAAGDPRILMRAKLEKDIEKLQVAKRRHGNDIERALREAERKKDDVKRLTQESADLRDDASHYASEAGKDFEITIKGKVYTDRKLANDALQELQETYKQRGDKFTPHEIGEYRGFQLYARYTNALRVSRKSSLHSMYSVSSIDGHLRNLEQKAEKAEAESKEASEFIERAEQLLNQPFPKQELLEKKEKRLRTLLKEMSDNQPSPSWFRNATPVGSEIWHNGKDYTVAGHRGATDVLIDENGEFKPIPADEVTSKDGTPLYPDLFAKREEAAKAAKEAEDAKKKDSDDTSGPAVSAMSTPKSFAKKSVLPPKNPAKQTLSMHHKGSQRNAGTGTSTRTEDDIKATSILKTWERIFGVPLRIGGFKERAEGLYKYFPQVVRRRERNFANLAVAAHEIAHHIDGTVDITRKNRSSIPRWALPELRNLDYDPNRKAANKALLETIKLQEGFAEFIRHFICETDAQVQAPRFYRWFTDTWALQNPAMYDKLIQAQRHARQYADQSVFQRVRTLMDGVAGQDLDFKERYKKSLQQGFRKGIADVADKLYAFELIDKEFERRGGKSKIKLKDAAVNYAMSESSNAAAAAEQGVHDLQTHEPIGTTVLWDIGKNLEGRTRSRMRNSTRSLVTSFSCDARNRDSSR